MRKSAAIVLLLLLGGCFMFVIYGIRRHYLLELKEANEAARDQRIIINELLSVQFRNWQTKGNLPIRQQVTGWKNRQTTTFQELLKGRKLLIYADYKMCKPCVLHNFSLIDSISASYVDQTEIIIYSPGANSDCGLNLPEMQTRIWMTDQPLRIENVIFETPCYLLMDHAKIEYGCHSVKNTDMPVRLFESLFSEFFSTGSEPTHTNKNHPSF